MRTLATQHQDKSRLLKVSDQLANLARLTPETAILVPVLPASIPPATGSVLSLSALNGERAGRGVEGIS